MSEQNTQEITVELAELGATTDQGREKLDRRLFMQLQVFSEIESLDAITEELKKRQISSVVYKDVSDPYGIGLLLYSENPDEFTTSFRDFYQESPLRHAQHDPSRTMFGRTYTGGYETNLEHWLINKPIGGLMDENCPWAVWYPLRRKSEFNLLPWDEQAPILREHGHIGHAYGKKGLAHDIRLAAHGLDENDNDFVIGITSPKLHVISKLIQQMRSTIQTGRYMESLGPFFIGRVAWRSIS